MSVEDDIAHVCRVAELGDGLCIILLVGPKIAEQPVLEAIAERLRLSVRWHDLTIDGSDLQRRLSAGERIALLIHGLDADEPLADKARLRALNLKRDTLRDADAALLLWIPADRLSVFQQQCADVFAWRAAMAEFGPKSVADLQMPVGTLLGGRFRLRERVYGGQRIDVWRAWDTMTETTVAIKALSHELTGPSVRWSFQRNCQRLREITHPGVARVISPAREEGPLTYAAFEWVGGRSVHQIVEDRSLDRHGIAHLARGGLSILADLWREGIHHGGITPLDLMLTADGDGKWLNPGRDLLTWDWGEPVGLAPEYFARLAGKPIELATFDVWSMGMLIMYACRAVPRERPTEDRERPALADLSVPLREVVSRAVRPRPSDRFANVAAFHRAWVDAMGD